jgi:hypothetical protein
MTGGQRLRVEVSTQDSSGNWAEYSATLTVKKSFLKILNFSKKSF